MHLSMIIIKLALFASYTLALGEIGKYDTPPGGVEFTGEPRKLSCLTGAQCPKDSFCCGPGIECVDDACPVNIDSSYTGGNWINGELIFKRSQRVRKSRGKKPA